MNGSTAIRGGWIAGELAGALLLGLAYFAAYYAMVVPVETRIRIRTGSTEVVRLRMPEPAYSLKEWKKLSFPNSFWTDFFSPAWRVDRIIRADLWRGCRRRSDGRPGGSRTM